MTVVEGLYSGLAAGSPPRGGRRLSTAGPVAQAAAAEAKMVCCFPPTYICWCLRDSVHFVLRHVSYVTWHWPAVWTIYQAAL